MKRFIFPACAALALLVAVALPPPQARAQQIQNPLTTTVFTLTASNPTSPAILFSSNITSCSVVVYSINGTLTPQSSSDVGPAVAPGLASWVTAANVNSGAISATGTFTGPISATGLSGFQVVLTSGTTATALLTCSAAVARAPTPSAAPTGTPFGGVQSVVGSNNILCTPTTGAVGCSEVVTPQPQNTASPNVSITTSPGPPTIAVAPTAYPWGVAVKIPAWNPIFQDSGNNSASTGTTANTYSELTNATGTTGVSAGPAGNWSVLVFAQGWVGATSAQGVYLCVAQSGTSTTISSSRQTGSTNCFTTLAGSVMGGPVFGSNSAIGAAVGYQSTLIGHFTVPNSTTYNFGLYAASGGTVSIAVNGLIFSVATQN